MNRLKANDLLISSYIKILKSQGHNELAKNCREIYEGQRGEILANSMKTYMLYLKSHIEAPDFEDTVEARDKKEALELFKKRTFMLDEIDDETLLENIGEV